MRLMSFDPGKNIGVTVWEDGKLLEGYVISGMKSILEVVEKEIANGLDVVVCELFVRGVSSAEDQSTTIELIGAIKMLSVIKNLRFVGQYPVNRVGYLPFAKELLPLKKVPAKVRRHAIDSAAHAIRFFEKENIPWMKVNPLPNYLKGGYS